MHLTILDSASAQCAAAIVPFTSRRCSHLRLHRQMRMRTVVAAGGSTEGGTLAYCSRTVTMHQAFWSPASRSVATGMMCNACASSIVRQCTRTRGRQGVVTVALDVVVASCVAGADQESTRQQADAESPAAVRQRLEAQQQRQQKQRRRQADSTDWFASTLTRRFGLAGGLAWLGFLSFGVISEQVLGFQTMPRCTFMHSQLLCGMCT